MCKQHNSLEEPEAENIATCFDFTPKKIQSEHFANIKNG